MKKIGIGIAIIFAILFETLPYCLAEQEAKWKLTKSKEMVEVGEEFEIGVAVENEKIVACQITIYWDTTKLELLSQNENTHSIDNRIGYVWYDQTGGLSPKTGELVRFRFRCKEAGNISFRAQGQVYDEVGREINLSAEEIQMQMNSADTTLPVAPEEKTQRNENTNLENLAIEDILLYPPFEPSVTAYTAEVGKKIEAVKLLAVPEQEKATVEIEGNEALQEGENTIIVRVTAPSGNKKEYRIMVYKRNEQEEAKYEEEQAQMVEKVKQAYEIEKLSMQTVREDDTKIEEKAEEPQKVQQKEGIMVVLIGIFLGVLWYVVEIQKKKK